MAYRPQQSNDNAPVSLEERPAATNGSRQISGVLGDGGSGEDTSCKKSLPPQTPFPGNLCRPDASKSCAACCGLYNVPDARRETLLAKLAARTELFRRTDRTIEAIEAYQSTINAEEQNQALEPLVHVCEFAGFLDPDRRVVGCQLHPSADGNRGVDFRGLCYYGSMACKAFFCPAWKEIAERHLELVVNIVTDWHLYGLVVTDVDYVRSLFGLLEQALGSVMDPSVLVSGPAREILEEMLAWKDAWPLSGSPSLRRSRYFFKASQRGPGATADDLLASMLESLQFTFGKDARSEEWEELVLQTVQRFCDRYPAAGGHRQRIEGGGNITP